MRVDAEERMLRLNGEGPTTRERWKAFWSLWRTASKQSLDAIEPFYVLMNNWDWIYLANGSGDHYELLRFLPRDIRRHYVERNRRHRQQRSTSN